MKFKNRIIIVGILAAVGVVLTAFSLSSNADIITEDTAAIAKDYKFDRDGNLIRPEGYRTWVYVGTPLTPNDLNNGAAPFPEFHNVYIHPDDYKYYEKNGKWKDGTILIKELVSVGTKAAVSGNGYFMGEFIGLEATIKDSKRFKDEPGNWAYFSFSNNGGPLKDKASAFPTATCNACHAASAKDDFVFTQHYPVLRAAKNSK